MLLVGQSSWYQANIYILFPLFDNEYEQVRFFNLSKRKISSPLPIK